MTMKKLRMLKQRQQGFTLIELMIVVAVVGVLAAIAYPSYKEFVAKSRRAEAKTVLLSAQQWMERFYTENFRYDQNSAGTAVGTLFSTRFTTSPVPGQGTAVYNITVEVTSGVRDAYAVKATRIAGTAMATDRCGDYSVDHLGRKDLANYSGFADKNAAIADCWNR